jgi:hypothetical protein
MRSFIAIIISILLLPTIYYLGLPQWVLLIPVAHLVWIFITSMWYAIKRAHFDNDRK